MYKPDTARQGGFTTGVGNESNIVVNQKTYEKALKKVQMIDDSIAEDYHNMLVQIEDMCSTIFVVPDTIPRILESVDKMKSSLEQFRSLTDKAIICTRRFVDQIAVIDGKKMREE